MDREIASQESLATLGGLWRLLSDRCVSPADAMQSARWKLHQLRVASELGLAVPETLVTTDSRKASDFMAEGFVVAKAISDVRIADRDGEIYTLTESVDEPEATDSVRWAPTMFQRRIDKRSDLRVTVVGERIFAVQITTPPGAHLDFRDAAPELCTYEVIYLDGKTKAGCRQFLEAFGLRFGAFDFAKGEDETLWFLECNPGGEWGWLEPPTGLPITAALVDLLLDLGS